MALVKSLDFEENPVFAERKYGYGSNLHMGPILGDRKIKDALCYPHLMLTNHSKGPVFNPKKPIRSYTEADLRNFSHWASDNAKEKIEDYRTVQEYNRQNVTVEKKANWEDKVKIVQKIFKKSKRDSKKQAKYQKYNLEEPDFEEMPSSYTIYEESYNPDLSKQAEWSLKRMKKSIRGKSADQIKHVLLKDVEDNKLHESKLLEDFQSFQDVQQISGRKVHKMHFELMDDRMSKQLNASFMEPFDSLKGQLKGFSRKESHYLENKR